MSALSAAGFSVARVSASGQRRGVRRLERCIAGDVIAIANAPGTPHFAVEVGGTGKRLGVAFAELRAWLPAGFAPMVVRIVNRKRYYYASEDERFPTLAKLLAAIH
jgi:hypothetical protein